jgi:hypothetical protein
MLRRMDDSKVHDIAEQRDFGELVTVGAIASNSSVVVLLASLIVPIGVAIAGFVSGQTLLGVLGIVGIPVVYFGMGRVIGRVGRARDRPRPQDGRTRGVRLVRAEADQARGVIKLH